MTFRKNSVPKRLAIITGIVFALFVFWQGSKEVPMTGDWQEHLAVTSIAEFDGDLVTVKNIRNFRYGEGEVVTQNNYYDKTFDLREIKKVWFVVEPFSEDLSLAHTLLSFEFNNGDFLSISIETRKTKSQEYSIFAGLMRTYPLIYIAADERDVVMLRANVRKHNVYAYPVRLGDQANARVLLVDMLTRMTDLATDKPEWYNTIFANCTLRIAYHVNRVKPGLIPMMSLGLLQTAKSDELALKHGLIDTDLPIDEARAKYLITEKSQQVGDVPDYSTLIRSLD